MKIRKKNIGLLILLLHMRRHAYRLFWQDQTALCHGTVYPRLRITKGRRRTAADRGADTVERFAVAPQFNSTSMMIRTGQYRFDTYDYSRWYVNPADMITGFVLGTSRDQECSRAHIHIMIPSFPGISSTGIIDEFGETTDGKALVSIRVTLLDTSQQNPVGQIDFPKAICSVLLQSATGRQMASLQALSDAMKDVSARLIADIGLALNATAAK